MNVLTAMRLGFSRAVRVRRLWFLIWFFYLLLGGILVAPVAIYFAANPGHSLWSDQLLKDFDVQWLPEIGRYWHSESALTLAAVLGVTVLLAVLSQVFFAGGAMALFTRKETRYVNRVFFEECARYFWRFFRLFVFALICYGILRAFSGLLNKAADKIWGEGMVAQPLVYFGRFRLVLDALLFVYVNAAMDFAKLRIVNENRRSAVGAGFWGLRFAARNYLRVLVLFAVVLALGLLLIGVYRGSTDWLPRTGMGTLLLAVVTQVVLLCRIGLRLGCWAAEAEMYPPPPEPPPPGPPLVDSLVGAVVAPTLPAREAGAEVPLPGADEEAAGPA